jgi:hypothetical protein
MITLNKKMNIDEIIERLISNDRCLIPIRDCMICGYKLKYRITDDK